MTPHCRRVRWGFASPASPAVVYLRTVLALVAHVAMPATGESTSTAAQLDSSPAHAPKMQAAGCSKREYKDPNARHAGPPRCAVPAAATGAIRCCTATGACFSVCDHEACDRVSWWAARNECATRGARLCTRSELEVGRCCNRGCRLDQRYVWTSEACAQGTCAQTNRRRGGASPRPSECNCTSGCDVQDVDNSQYGQAATVAALFGRKRGGLFVDLAAHEPVVISNTRALERDLSWRGLCIDANPYYAARLRQERRCDVAQSIVADVAAPSAFNDNGGVGAIVADTAAARRRGIRVADSVPFNVLLRRHGAPAQIDYLSLDVEGAEYLVMKTFPWESHNVSVMTIERPNVQLRGVLRAHSYRHICNHGNIGDQLWVHTAKLKRLKLAFPTALSVQHKREAGTHPQCDFTSPTCSLKGRVPIPNFRRLTKYDEPMNSLGV